MAASRTAPPLATAGALLEAVVAHDFDQLGAAFDADASMSALLPGGFRQWTGSAAIRAAFEQWFGNVEHYEVTDASVGPIGSLVQMRWRLRIRGARFGAATKVVEQNMFTAAAPNGLIGHISLLCSGFWSERPDTSPAIDHTTHQQPERTSQ